jgi:hypothetical protein
MSKLFEDKLNLKKKNVELIPSFKKNLNKTSIALSNSVNELIVRMIEKDDFETDVTELAFLSSIEAFEKAFPSWIPFVYGDYENVQKEPDLEEFYSALVTGDMNQFAIQKVFQILFLFDREKECSIILEVIWTTELFFMFYLRDQ